MINKKTSYKQNTNKKMIINRLSKKNIRKSQRVNLRGGVNCDLLIDQGSCLARRPECLWNFPRRNCFDNNDPEVIARFAAANPIVVANPVAARAAANSVASRAVASRAAAARIAAPLVAAPVIYTQAQRNAAVAAFAAAAVVVPPIPVVRIEYQTIEIPDVIDYFNLQDIIIAMATEDYDIALRQYNRVGSQRALDAMEEARNRSDTAFNRKYESSDEPVRYNIIDNILDAGSIPPQQIDPNLLLIYGDLDTYDIFEGQNVTIYQHLSADTDNIVIFYRRNVLEDFNAVVLTFTQLKLFLKDSTNIYYSCNPDQAHSNYRLTPPEYVKIPTDTATIYASYSEMRQRCINGQRMIFLQYNHRINTSMSFHVSAGVAYTEDTGQFCPALVSANHCQLGTNIDIYNIIA
jgi:hypothetical protein